MVSKDDERVAMLPGDGDAEDHIVERVCPSKGRIQRMMEQAREGHRVAEEDPERGAYHGGPPVEDMGGVTVPYEQETASPSSFEGHTGRGVKMKIQTFEEAKAELLRARAKAPRSRGSDGEVVSRVRSTDGVSVGRVKR